MAGGGGNAEENYWPGFVDALANVVLTLVFVLVVFVFALAMLSAKVENKVTEILEAQEQQKIEHEQSITTIEQLQQQIDQLSQQKIQLEEMVNDKNLTGAKSVKGVADRDEDREIEVQEELEKKKTDGPVKVISESNNITLGYPLSVVDMDEESAAKLGHVLDALKKKVGPNRRILLRSVIGRESYSAARRLAYYRAIGVRNYLISTAGESPSSISSVIVQPDQPEDGHVEIIVQKK